MKKGSPESEKGSGDLFIYSVRDVYKRQVQKLVFNKKFVKENITKNQA